MTDHTSPLDVEACVRLLTTLASELQAHAESVLMTAEGAAAYAAEAAQARALASALPGMGKDSERWRYMRDVAWHEARPAELPGDLAATIYRLTGGVRHPTAEHLDSAVDDLIAARAAQPQETSADG